MEKKLQKVYVQGKPSTTGTNLFVGWIGVVTKQVNIACECVDEEEGILLTPERYEALCKCAEALDQIRTIEASNNERWSYEAMNICEQSLQTLKQTNNE